MTETAEKPNYKKTLNLPKTSFPMRANLAQNEPASQKRWSKRDLYHEVDAVRRAANAEPFVFHDGPPYANGSIHVGHLLNKVLKDFVVRSQLMMGKQCTFVPGWDCHGLPIEHRVMTELHESGKIAKIAALEDDVRRMAIRKACGAYAAKYVKLQAKQMQRLSTLADYDAPYLTMTPPYEQSVLEVFAAMVEQGIVYRDLKPVHWSIANQTALAEAELEYEDREDTSVFVDFEADDRAAVASVFGVELDSTPSFMIWTTTPWTLPANLAVAVHERYQYALVRIDGNVTVLATERINAVTEPAGAEDVEILAEVPGSALVGLKYRHPFCDRVSPVVSAEYVTLEDGTGLVHTAPGHGTEDYITGLREGLDVYCPVRDDGTFDDTVPEWLRGQIVWDANAAVVEHLRESGHLFYDHVFMHSYPHDWRSKTPVIFRSTEQWFISVDNDMSGHGKSLRQLGLNACDNEITFYPAWGKNRLRGMLDTRPDWCISRQRSWGLPIPAFAAPDGSVFMTTESVRAVSRAFGERGSDAWFKEPAAELLADYNPANDPDAPDGLDVAALTKMYDIFDVWFESGSSWHAAMRQRELGFPVDLYLEGSDQHRGWFQLSLLPGLGMTGHTPFTSVLTHGFMVAKDGRKMSKSGGNALDVDDLLKDYGADVCRWWVSSLAFENDIKVDIEFFTLAGESYRKVRNTLRFLLSNLGDFDPAKDAVALADLDPTSLDAYVLSLAGELQEQVLKAFTEYEFRKAHQLLYDFCNETLSAFYCAAVKDRLYCDRVDAPRRRSAQTVLHTVAHMLVRLLAPIVPHSADEAFSALSGDQNLCVQLETIADPPAVTVDADFATVMKIRDDVLRALEQAKEQGINNSLDAEVLLPDPKGVLAKFKSDLPDMLGVSRVICDAAAEAVSVKDLRDQPCCERSWKRDGTVKQRSDGGMLSDRDAEAVGVGD